MATVYILYSPKLNKYYIGSCQDLTQRLQQHQEGFFHESFTEKANDWEVFYQLDDLGDTQSRKIESHIKKMKSKKYIENIRAYPEIAQKLKALYS